MPSWLTYQWRKLTQPRVVNNGGIRLFLGDVVDRRYARAIYRDSHESEEREIISRHLREDDVVVEFGAGLGQVTVLSCLIAGSESVHAFEANPAMLPVLRKTFELNGVRPSLHMNMVSLDEGPRSFFVADRFVSSSRFEAETQKAGAAGRTQTVESVSMESVMKQIRPTFLIMDIEGSETDLISEQIDLSGVRAICVEVHPAIVGDSAVSKLIASLLDRGFLLHISECWGDVLYFSRGSDQAAVTRAA